MGLQEKAKRYKAKLKSVRYARRKVSLVTSLMSKWGWVKYIGYGLATAVGWIKARWRISNLTICLMGAALGLFGGLFLLRGFIFHSGLAMYSDLYWVYGSHQYPMYYLWDEFRQAPTIINHMLVYLPLYIFSAEVSERLLFLMLFTAMGISMFFTTFKLTAPRHRTARVPLVASTLATLFFMINPVICMRPMHYFLIWYYPFLPILVYFSYTAFRDIGRLKTWSFVKKAIIVALILSVMSGSERLPFFFPFLLLGLLAGFHRPYSDYVKMSALFIGLTLVLYSIFSAAWLLPIALGIPIAPNDFYVLQRGWVQTLSGDVSLFDAFRLHPFWLDSLIDQTFKYGDITGPLWTASVTAAPIIAFGALLLRRSKFIVWLAIFAMGFMFLSKGTNPPFGSFYEWLTFDSPVSSLMGWQFRESGRFTVPLMFCYAMLFGLATSHLFGWARDRIKWARLRKAAYAMASIILLGVPLISGYPLLTGDLNDLMKPKELSVDWVDLNRWMEGSEGKVIYYAEAPIWGSPIPTTPRSVPWEPCRDPLGVLFARRMMENGSTLRLGELYSPWNAKYIVFRGDLISGGQRDNILSVLSAQQDLKLARQFGPLYVYENCAPLSQVATSTQSLLVLGVLENMLSLTTIDSYNMLNSSIVFADQLVSSGDYLATADVVVSDQNNLDLYLSQLDDKYIISAFDAVDKGPTGWIKATADDLMHGDWHYYLGLAGVSNWQFDYKMGLLRSHSTDPQDIHFRVDTSGVYDILVRCLQNARGGHITVSVDGEPTLVPTENQVNEFRWLKVGTFQLGKGEHTLTIRCSKGYNAVNILAVLPYGELERYEAQADNLIKDKRLVYIWEGELALNRSGAGISTKYDSAASNSMRLVIPAGSQAWQDIELAKSAEYRMGLKLVGSTSVSIDGEEFTVGSDGQDFVYLGPLDLEKGMHSLKVNPVAGESCELDVIWLYSINGNDERVENIFTSEDSPARVIEYEKVNPTKYRVSVNATRPFMLEFAEAYNKLWVASVNGVQYPSVPLNAVVNGFWIDDTGDLEITIEFESQGWFYWGTAISIVGLISALAFAVWSWRRKKK